MATRAKRPKRVIRRKKIPSAKAPSPVPPPPPPPEDLSMLQMRAAAARADAQRRVAAFMERTSNLPWMRQRFGSFEVALLGGLKNLITEAERDEAQNRNSESYAAHCAFLYGLLTSLRHLFFWAALEARIADTSNSLGRAPEMEDAEKIMRELDIFNSAATRDDVQARFRGFLSANEEVMAARKRVLTQARAFDLLNSLKDMPKA